METCKNCNNWFRVKGKLAEKWNLCRKLSQNTLKNCFIVPSFPELADTSIVRTCTTYKDFGCNQFEEKAS